MSNPYNEPGKAPDEFPAQSTGPQGQGPEEFDPNADYGSTEIQVASAQSAGTVETDEGLLAAKEALIKRLGGSDVMASAQLVAGMPEINGLDNIKAIGVGMREAGGAYTGEPAVKVFVQAKAPLSRIASKAVIPPEIDGFPTDVEEIGEIRPLGYTGRYPRPVPCGVSCGHVNITAGTIGCLVVLNNNRLCILSNNHVLANENAANLGDSIIQPGRYDHGVYPNDVIGRLERFEPINFPGPNQVDAAVAWTSRRLVNSRHVTYQLNPTPLASAISLSVLKNGRTTQATQGVITAHRVDNVPVGYSGGRAIFNDQIIVRGIGSTPFSQGGDSGSLVVSSGTKQPVGLLFAGSSTHTIINPIAAVIRAMGIREFVAG